MKEGKQLNRLTDKNLRRTPLTKKPPGEIPTRRGFRFFSTKWSLPQKRKLLGRFFVFHYKTEPTPAENLWSFWKMGRETLPDPSLTLILTLTVNPPT